MLLNQDDHLSVMGHNPILVFPVKKAFQDFEFNLTPPLAGNLQMGRSVSDTAKTSSVLCLNCLYTSRRSFLGRKLTTVYSSQKHCLIV